MPDFESTFPHQKKASPSGGAFFWWEERKWIRTYTNPICRWHIGKPVRRLVFTILFCCAKQQSNPPSPTKHEKSELLPCGDWVRIFCLYQGYCILILYPLALCDYRTRGFFCLKVLLEVCCRIQYNYGKNDFISEVKRM